MYGVRDSYHMNVKYYISVQQCQMDVHQDYFALSLDDWPTCVVPLTWLYLVCYSLKMYNSTQKMASICIESAFYVPLMACVSTLAETLGMG